MNSRSSLGDIAFADRLARQCTHHEVPPERVILELTETSALADPTTSLDLLTRLTPSAPPIPAGPGPKPAPLNPGG